MTRCEVPLPSSVGGAQYNGAGTNYVIEANNGSFYKVFIASDSDVYFNKSSDGITWGTPVSVFTGTALALSVWYDRWSGRSTDKIRCWYIESGGNDILYRDIDTASADALGTQTTVFNGASASIPNGALTGWVSRHGELRAAGSIDAGAEDGAWSSTDDGATWTDTIADPSEGATQDQYFGLPGWNADTADEMIIFVDASANGLSVKRYDDSANTWTETAIIADGSFVDQTASNAFPHVACAVDLANSRNIVAAWSAVDTANADLRLFFINDTTITESAANVVLNSTDDQGLCAVGIDTPTGMIYVFYGGKSDGSETYLTAITINYKTTSNDGANWSAETALTTLARATQYLACTPRFTTEFLVAFSNDLVASDDLMVSAQFPIQPRARSMIGLG